MPLVLSIRFASSLRPGDQALSLVKPPQRVQFMGGLERAGRGDRSEENREEPRGGTLKGRAQAASAAPVIMLTGI